MLWELRVVLRIKSFTFSDDETPELVMIEPDASGSLAQLEASLGPWAFTSVSGVGDQGSGGRPLPRRFIVGYTLGRTARRI